MSEKDSAVIEVMKDLSRRYLRFGSRRIRIFLERKGLRMSQWRCSRLWRQAGWQVSVRNKRRRKSGSAAQSCALMGKKRVWSCDFVVDACANGQVLTCLAVVDEVTRECLAIDVGGSIRAERGIEVLDRLIDLHGAPDYPRGPRKCLHFWGEFKERQWPRVRQRQIVGVGDWVDAENGVD